MPVLTYKEVLAKGHLVTGLTTLNDVPTPEGDESTWFAYGVVRKLTAHSSHIELFWINHATRSVCPRVDIFGEEINPVCPKPGHKHHVRSNILANVCDE